MRLFFRKSGSGRPLIILHGLFGLGDNWATLSKKWSEFFTVYAVDLRNHGQSPRSEEWNYSLMAEDVFELIRGEHLEEVSILGHSMGGKVAMRLALDHPQVISKLIVSDIAPREYPIHNLDVIHALEEVDLNMITSRKDAEQILAKKLTDSSTLQFLLKNLYWKEISADEKKLAWRFNLEVISKKLHEVNASTIPAGVCETETLFIRGSKSNYITNDDEREIHARFSNSSIVTIQDAGHWVHADKPEEMFEEVKKFIS